MKKGRFFPEVYRAFCNGNLALCLDRFGGIESVHLLDIHNENGKLFPERRPWRLFSREGTAANRPLIYPALRYLRELQDGSIRTFAPEYPDIYPSAVTSDEYNMFISNECFSHELSDTLDGEKRSFILAITKASYFEHTENTDANYNQLAHENTWLPPQYRGENFNPDIPLADGISKLEHTEPFFDEKTNSLIFTTHVYGNFFEKDAVMVFTATEKLFFDEDCNQWTLKTAQTGKRKIRFACGIANDTETALQKALHLLENHHTELAAHIDCKRFPKAIQVKIQDMPEASLFTEVFPYYQNALCMADNGQETAIRAAFNKFGFFPIWDHIYPARDFLLTGEIKTSRKVLKYMLDYPHWDTTPFVLMHLAIALNEYLAFTDDDELRHAFYEPFKKAFAFAKTLVDEKTGLIRYGIDTAVDIMPEIGINGLFHASCVNGWWYNCCCCLINFALMENDSDFAAEVGKIEEKIAENFLKVFYSPQTGWLKAAVDANFNDAKCNVFLQNKTLAEDYIHGSWLLRKVRQPMSDYLMKHLHHPMGVAAVSYDSEAPAVYLKGTRMNQHLGHSCKHLRNSNRIDGVNHLLKNYLYAFGETLNAIETFNYSTCKGGGESQLADWQAFSATAAMQAIVQGKAGLAWHRGGLFFVPANDSAECSIANLHFNKRKYSMQVKGSGSFAEIYLNGRKLEGSMQLPSDLLMDDNFIEVKRTGAEPDRPVVYLLTDIEITGLKSAPGELHFTAVNSGFSKMEFFTPSPAEMFINGSKVNAEYDNSAKRLWFSGTIPANSEIKITNMT